MARIIVNIPDSMIKAMYDNGKGVIDVFKTELYQRLIYQSDILPDNATNGDAIKALFPDIEIADTPCLDKVYTGISFGKYIGANIDCMREWWNAPYKAGDIDGKSD